MTDKNHLDDVATQFGIKKSTVTSYHSRGQMPAADGYDKQGPWWTSATLASWERPGRGRRRQA
jgi:hypothetical protein